MGFLANCSMLCHYRLAAFHGHELVVRELLAASAPLEAEDLEGAPPLLRVAFGGRHGAMTALLDAGANIMACDSVQMTALHHAAIRGQAQLLAPLLDARADLHACARDDRTPLHIAAHGYKDCDDLRNGLHLARDANMTTVRVLLAARADAAALDAGGMLPCHFAQERHPHVYEFLCAAVAAAARSHEHAQSKSPQVVSFELVD
mmetsp:Transcript_28571/g.55927  ORF Transcript_28571/g.55927 Transcript_28571/m.55927 type:complete len:204 (+) Transcript_28571:47-658(+)